MRFTSLALLGVGLGVSVANGQTAANWVSVTGQVVLPAQVPVPGPKAIPARPGLVDESVIVNPVNRGVKNVVVWLRPDDTGLRSTLASDQIHPADARRKPREVVIDNPRGQFVSRILAARVGDTVVVKNSSPVNHLFKWDSGSSGQHRVALTPNEWCRLPDPLAAENVPIDFSCQISPWMVGYLRVFDHPYYAVTDGDGKFEIGNAPAGKFRMVMWHEKVGYLRGKEGRFGEPLVIADGGKGAMALKPTAFDVTK